MKNRGRLAILFVPLLLVVGAFVLTQLLRQYEGPRHQGRSLYRWMKDLRPYQTGVVRVAAGGGRIVTYRVGNPPFTPVPVPTVATPAPNPPSTEQVRAARQAIYELGTNAIPFLVTYYFENHQDKHRSIVPVEWHQKLYSWNQKYVPRFQIIPPVLNYEHEYARAALMALREKAVFALPFVLDLVQDGIMSSLEEKRFYEYLVKQLTPLRVNELQPEVISILVDISANGEHLNSEQWILYLWTVQLWNLTDPKLVPAIEPILTHPNGMVQYQAIRAIAMFGTNAAPVIPILESVLDDQNYQAAYAARESIAKINDAAKP